MVRKIRHILLTTDTIGKRHHVQYPITRPQKTYAAPHPRVLYTNFPTKHAAEHAPLALQLGEVWRRRLLVHGGRGRLHDVLGLQHDAVPGHHVVQPLLDAVVARVGEVQLGGLDSHRRLGGDRGRQTESRRRQAADEGDAVLPETATLHISQVMRL